MIETMDRSMGRMLDALDRLGLADNTVVFFMSDNGGLSTAEGAPTSNLPLRAGKGWLYEGGIREPMIVKWPGVTKPGSTSTTPVISTDFYPTILEMAGLPARPEQHVDGVSMVPLLRQTGSTAPRAIYWHYPHYGNQGGSPGSAVRLGDWKLIEFFEDHRLELYNLKNDLGSGTTWPLEQPGKAAELHQRLKAWRAAVGGSDAHCQPELQGQCSGAREPCRQHGGRLVPRTYPKTPKSCSVCIGAIRFWDRS